VSTDRDYATSVGVERERRLMYGESIVLQNFAWHELHLIYSSTAVSIVVSDFHIAARAIAGQSHSIQTPTNSVHHRYFHHYPLTGTCAWVQVIC
jgi:hypothetical protein